MTFQQRIESELWEKNELTAEQMEGAKRAIQLVNQMFGLPPTGNVVILPATLDPSFTVGDGELKTKVNLESSEDHIIGLNRIKNCAVRIVAVEGPEQLELKEGDGEHPGQTHIEDVEKKTRRGRKSKADENQDEE